MTRELLEKARAAKSPEELLKSARENGIPELTEESSKEYFESMHKSGELTDDELETAAGGCKTNGHTTVTCDRNCHCRQWDGLYFVKTMRRSDNVFLRKLWYQATLKNPDSIPGKCGTCCHLGFSAGAGCCEIQ